MDPRLSGISASGYTAWLLRHRVLVLWLAALLAVVAGYRTVLTYAALKSDLEELLPESAPSVRALSALRSRVSGIRHLGVVVELPRPERLDAANRFIDALAARVRGYPKTLVAEVRVDGEAERVFASTYALQLMDPADVRKLREAVEARRDWDVSRQMGIDLDDGEPRPELPIPELRKKYEEIYGTPRRTPGDRFVAPDGKSAVLLIRAAAHDTGQSVDRVLLNRVKADVEALGFPGAFASDLRVGYAADVAMQVEELSGLESDLTASGAIVLLLVLGALVSFYRTFRVLPILFLPLTCGTLWAFAIVALPPLSIVYLNTNTAFLGSIIVGNGINSGIILLARFQEERRNGLLVVPAIELAVQNTWKATLAAALAAATAYGSLIFTDFRGFNQFGWIGGFGMVLTWASIYLIVPILVVYWGGPLAKLEASGAASAHRVSPITRWAIDHPKFVLGAFAALAVLSTIGILQRSGNWIEYDLSKLRRRDSWESGERYWGKRMDAALGRYLTPTLVLPETPEEAQVIDQRVRALKAGHGAGDLIASVRSAATFLRPDRFESIEEAKKLAEVLTPRMKRELTPEDRDLVERALSAPALVPLTAKDLPRSVVLGLREVNGRIDRNVLVVPKLNGGTWDAERLETYARDLRAAATIDGQQRAVAGPLLISSDIAKAMMADGPRASALSLGAVLLICWFAFRRSDPDSRRRVRLGYDRMGVGLSLASMVSLFVGVLLTLGLVAWSGERLNFSNFVALPITFGVSADYAINMLRRYQAEPQSSLAVTLSRTGGAVALCSAATVIGYGSLIMAQNRALFSFGVLAIAGELMCLATAVIGLPAALSFWQRRTREAPAGPLSAASN
jgi:predicted RND superfamily exporter protein